MMNDSVADARITAVIVNYRTSALALHCMRALLEERKALPMLDIILVDGGSNDGSADVMETELSHIDHFNAVSLLPLTVNGGFGWANNQAIRRALGRTPPAEFIFLINPDAEIEPNALVTLVTALRSTPDAAAAGSLLIGSQGEALGSAFRFPTIGSEFLRGANTPLLGRLMRHLPIVVEASETVGVDWVTGASVLLRGTALRECGLFDEGFFLYFEEVELMHRFHAAGWRGLHVPASRVHHIGGAATGVLNGASEQRRLPDYWFQSRRRFFARAYGPSSAWLAGLAWLAGNAVWQLRTLLGLGRASALAPFESRDLIRNGLGASESDRRAAAGRHDEPLDVAPIWMRW